MEKMDYKKAYRELYQPKSEPSVIKVPEMKFIQVDGRGNPNEPDGEYQAAVQLLYVLTYTIKMSPKSGCTPEGYFDYAVPPLEGLWWLEDSKEDDFSNKSDYCWTSMIRQPEFVTEQVFAQALLKAQKKKPEIDFSKARLVSFKEGLCIQCMHIGSFDDEPATLARMKLYIEDMGYVSDLSESRRHHEIYLNDPRKINVAKMKTILRLPVKNNN